MKKLTKSSKKVVSARRTVKKRTKQMRGKTIEKEYRTVFSPIPLPSQGQYTDEDSLEQPSALKYVPSTTRTTVEMAVDPQMRRNAQLARDIH
jgi:hypothetical protein